MRYMGLDLSHSKNHNNLFQKSKRKLNSSVVSKLVNKIVEVQILTNKYIFIKFYTPLMSE